MNLDGLSRHQVCHPSTLINAASEFCLEKSPRMFRELQLLSSWHAVTRSASLCPFTHHSLEPQAPSIAIWSPLMGTKLSGNTFINPTVLKRFILREDATNLPAAAPSAGRRLWERRT